MSKSQTGEERKVTIAPMLSVRNGKRAIEFYKAAFDAQVPISRMVGVWTDR